MSLQVFQNLNPGFTYFLDRQRNLSRLHCCKMFRILAELHYSHKWYECRMSGLSVMKALMGKQVPGYTIQTSHTTSIEAD